MKKLLILLILLICQLTMGCSDNSASRQDKILYSVQDSTGATINFTEKPQRIITLNVSADEVILDLVDNKRIIALSALADDISICSAYEKAQSIPGRVQGNNIENILLYQPDLVIVPNYDNNTINALRSTGLKTYVYQTPSNLDEIFKFIEDLSLAVGESENGRKLIKNMQSKLSAVKDKVDAHIPDSQKLKVIALSFNGPLGMKGTFSEVCHYAGVKNSLANIDIPYKSELSEEKMLEINPDLIITPSWDYSKKGNPEDFRQKILNNPTYQDLNAIKHNRVIRLHDNYLYSTSQYFVYAVEELSAKAYPEIFQ